MNTEFGALVEYLRLSRQTHIGNKPRQWTREILAKNAGISVGTLKAIEKGTNKNPILYVQQLADALQLTEYQKHHFYAVAGLIYPQINLGLSLNEVYKLLEDLDCPAYARTPLWDLIAFNDYHRLVWGYTEKDIHNLDAGELGSNLLRVLFEEDFRKQSKSRNSAAIKSMKLFRGESFKLVAGKRYKHIMLYFAKNKAFQQAWNTTEFDDNEELLSEGMLSIVRNEKYGELQFITTRIQERYVGDKISVSVYHPLPFARENWDKLKNDVHPHKVYRFRIPSEE